MTEDEWRASAEPKPLLEFLDSKASDRKLRLFACSCCRAIWKSCADADERYLRAVVVSEAYADGLADRKTLKHARRAAWDVAPQTSLAQWHAADAHAWQAAACAAEACACRLGTGRDEPGMAKQAALLREIFGNPFRPASLAPALLTWRDRTIPKLAQAAYDERELPSGHLDAKRFAILADALEEAGCTNEDVLAHLRGPGPHVRGCWVVDLLLGRE